ncbi:MAG: hypothetical protein ACRD72_02310 [Candidatus Angelobacter sp.]|jgi:hypothetical protein
MPQQQLRCAICNCELHREGDYAKPTPKGRSHATEHHYVAERFFGRSANRRGTVRERLFGQCPWGLEGNKETYCYECHEELLHNPVLLPADIKIFATLVKQRGLDETKKDDKRDKLAGRIELFHEIIAAGLAALSEVSKLSRALE